ncbi:MAG: toll/interleukin-1 receptor domain-containing protein, partial [Planctomycetes bacterium]|nr:toll/interleukin-1 receptor domain-containing protein [Planctomycetota bacterium]
MGRDVFISYSSKDAERANAVVETLERAGLACWIAPRDIPAGSDYPSTLVDAIARARAMVVLVSGGANESAHVHNEVHIAVSEGLVIVPFRIQDVPLAKTLRYFLGRYHWLDAVAPPPQAHLDRLTRTLEAILEAKGEPETSPPPPGAEPVEAWLHLRIPRRSPGRTGGPSQLLLAHNEFIELVGREEELRELETFRDDPRPLRWMALVGAGGVGKTRLAIEFARRSAAAGWYSGFLDAKSLDALVHHAGFPRWTPCVPALILVDYAASKIAGLEAFLERLAAGVAQKAGAGAPPSSRARVILLERHANVDQGW